MDIGSWRSKVRNIMGTMVMKKVFKVQKLNEITQRMGEVVRDWVFLSSHI